MFIGREKELVLLQQDYIGKAVMVYGKRRMLPIKKRAIACGAVVPFFACFLFGLVVK